VATLFYRVNARNLRLRKNLFDNLEQELKRISLTREEGKGFLSTQYTGVDVCMTFDTA